MLRPDKSFYSLPIFPIINKKQTESVNIYNKDDQNGTLENQKQEIFSFGNIKPSLECFKMDGDLLAKFQMPIKKTKNIKIYKLCTLGDSNNQNQRRLNTLIDYKKKYTNNF